MRLWLAILSQPEQEAHLFCDYFVNPTRTALLRLRAPDYRESLARLEKKVMMT